MKCSFTRMVTDVLNVRISIQRFWSQQCQCVVECDGISIPYLQHIQLHLVSGMYKKKHFQYNVFMNTLQSTTSFWCVNNKFVFNKHRENQIETIQKITVVLCQLWYLIGGRDGILLRETIQILSSPLVRFR